MLDLSPIFHGQLKKRPITLIIWVLGRVEKMPEKVQKKRKIFFFVKNKYKSVTHVSTIYMHFSRVKYSLDL